MSGKPRYTTAQVIAALHATKGMVHLAARQLGCDVDTVINYCKRHPTVQAAKEAERGEMVDLAELKLYQSIQNGEAWGITLCLRTLGRDRGYVERQELTGQEGAPMTLRVVYQSPAPEPAQVAVGRNGTALPPGREPQALQEPEA